MNLIWSSIQSSNLISTQDKCEFEENMEKFDKLKKMLKKDDKIDDLKKELQELASFKSSSTTGIKMNIYTIPDLTVLLNLKRGDFLYRAVSFEKEMSINRQSLFSIRSNEDTKYSGRLHCANHPVLYLSTDYETAIEEANTSDSEALYVAKYSVKTQMTLKSIFVNVNPYTQKSLEHSDRFTGYANGYPDWYIVTVNEMIRKTFMIPDLKDTPLEYKLTLAIANAFFPLREVISVEPPRETNYSGWLYNSVVQETNGSEKYNIALTPVGVNNLELKMVNQIKDGKSINCFLPATDGSLFLKND